MDSGILLTFTTAYQRVNEPDAAEKRPISIAILRFDDTSDGADQAHLGEGIAAELIGSLALVPGLRVASRTSAFASRARFSDTREFARSLGAEFLLHGSVHEAEGPVHLDARLVRVADGSELWSGKRNPPSSCHVQSPGCVPIETPQSGVTPL